MENKNSSSRKRIIVSSSHIDKHNHIITKEALYSALPFLNGDRKVRFGLDHNKTFPPLGRISDGEVIQGEDGEYYLVAYQEYFDVIETLTLASGLKLIRESFLNENYPFVECKFKPVDVVEVKYDFVNLGSYNNGKKFAVELKAETEYNFKSSEFIRKSEIPDPEIVITLTEVLAIALGFGLKKIPEKIGDAVADDIVKFYKLLSGVIKKSVTELLPKNRPIHFVVEIPIGETITELIVTTRNPDLAIKAFDKSIISNLIGDIRVAINDLGAEKIQFYLNEEKTWEMNYLITNEGKVIGTKKSFKKRDDFFQSLVNKQSNDNA